VSNPMPWQPWQSGQGLPQPWQAPAGAAMLASHADRERAVETLTAQYVREGDTLRLSDVQLHGDGISASGNLLVHSLAEKDPVVAVEADAAPAQAQAQAQAQAAAAAGEAEEGEGEGDSDEEDYQPGHYTPVKLW